MVNSTTELSCELGAAHTSNDAIPMSSPTRGLEVLAAVAAVPTTTPVEDEEVDGMDMADESALPPVASAVVESTPPVPPSAFEQGEIIARQQQEIAALRELVASQAAAIEQLRRAACLASAQGVSPPPLYGPSSPSTELASSEELDELSPAREHASVHHMTLVNPLAAAHAAAASLAAYATHDPARLVEGRPASAASKPPTPSRPGKMPRTPTSRHREGAADVGEGGKRMRAADGSSVAPSPKLPRDPSLAFSAVTLSLPPYKSTIGGMGPDGKAVPKQRPGGRTNTHVLWTPEEDACLRALVEEHGEQAWALVASRMPHERNNKQCRERWRNHLRPACNKGPWTEEEDRLILERVQEHGTKWAKISGLYLPDRPENDIKNRWHILIRMHSHGTAGGGPPPALSREVSAASSVPDAPMAAPPLAEALLAAPF